MISDRARKLNDIEYKGGKIFYLMSRDQRIKDNWALIYAIDLVKEYDANFEVVFYLKPDFLGATLRQYDFMLKGLKRINEKLRKLNISFSIVLEENTASLVEFLEKHNAGFLVKDFSPLKINKDLTRKLEKELDIPLCEVDAHNIVPAWVVSNKQEYSARFFRDKMNKYIDAYLDDFPKIKKIDQDYKEGAIDWEFFYDSLKVDTSVKPVEFNSGENAAMDVFKIFKEQKLEDYPENRNNPNKDVLSNLSPYLHFGQISSQRVVLEIKDYYVNGKPFLKNPFIDEIVVRKELSDNYCFYNDNYDNNKGFPDWAKKTLKIHNQDKRHFVYDLEVFEKAETHDDLWNAAQREMAVKGKMHGYMRMYWAKKILEWTDNSKEAQKIAIYLNDKYSLDGRDPNGYTGIAWSIGGVHDRAWFERVIFGKVRYMSNGGAERKFDTNQYIKENSIN